MLLSVQGLQVAVPQTRSEVMHHPAAGEAASAVLSQARTSMVLAEPQPVIFQNMLPHTLTESVLAHALLE